MKYIIQLLLLSPMFATAQSLDKFPVIDMHLHSYDSAKHFIAEAPAPGNTQQLSPKSYIEYKRQILKELEKNNVVLAIISGPLSHQNIWQNNEVTRFYFSLLSGEPQHDVIGKKLDTIKLKKLISEGKLKAIGEMPQQYRGRTLSDTAYEDLFTLAKRFQIPVGIHTGAGPKGTALEKNSKFKLQYGNPYLLEDLIIRHPKMKLYMMHGGLPNYGREGINMMRMYPNLYADIGAMTWTNKYAQYTLEQFLKEAIIAGVADRILFGSDQMLWPQAISLAIDYIKQSSFLTEKQKKDILYFNAARFLGLTDEQIKKDMMLFIAKTKN